MRRWLAGCGVFVAVAVSCVAAAGPAFGAADVERFTVSFPIVPEPVDDTCAGAGVVGVVSGTVTVDGMFVTTSTGRHFTGNETLDYRVDFPDGSYLLATQSSPRTFTGAQADRVVTFGSTLHERGTLYDADGNILGYEQFHARNRTTIVDGRVVADFDEGFITCH